jgi:antitoxin PrlF
MIQATLTSKNQITIPLAVRKKLGLHKGDHLVFMETDGQIVLQMRPKDPNPLSRFIGICAPENQLVTREKILEESREIREGRE